MPAKGDRVDSRSTTAVDRRRRPRGRYSRARRQACARRARPARAQPRAGSGSSGEAARASRRCSALVAGLDEPDAGTVSVFGEPASRRPARALRADAAARLPAAVANGARQCMPRAREPGRAAPRGAAPGWRRSSIASSSAVPSRCARRSCRAACASALPSSARCSRARTCCCSTSRSARSTRSRGPSCRSGCTDLLAVEPRTVLLVTHDVEEALLALRPRGRARRRARHRRARRRRPARPHAPRDRRRPVLHRAARACTGGDRMRRYAPPLALLARRRRRLGARRARARTCPTTSSPRRPRSRRRSRSDSHLLASATWVTAREVVLGYALAVACRARARDPASTSRRRCGVRCCRSSCSRRRCRRCCSRRSSRSCSGSGSRRS